MADNTKPAKQTRAKAQQFRIGFLVHDVSRMRRTLFDHAMKPLNVTRAQWWLLANLSRHDDSSMTQTELARVMDLGKVTIGGLIDRLEASGHLERRPDAKDRRVRHVSLTPLGFQVLDQMQSIGRGLNTQILQGITAEEVRIAEDVLHRMKENLREALIDLPVADEG